MRAQLTARLLCICLSGLLRCTKELDDFPDIASKHITYCVECHRLRVRAYSADKRFQVKWLRAALEADELRARLGVHAKAVFGTKQRLDTQRMSALR